MKIQLSITIPAAIIVCAFCSPTSANATMSTISPRGVKTVSIPVEGRKPEICVVPKHFPNANYSDKDATTEGALCSLDTGTNTAVCPKENSTNPGLDFFSVPSGTTIPAAQNANCKSAGVKMLAKYKVSTSCSYTPSILGYYHLSRMLGGLADVPPAVIRTYDLQRHVALGKIALAQTGSATLIHLTWESLMAQLNAGANAPRRDFLLTDDFTQSYGALVENPSHEAFYNEFFNGGANNVARAANFRDHNTTVQLLARQADVSTFVPRTFSQQNVQTMVQMKDASELIIMDTLMNQQDRFGNIHYLETYYYIENSNGTTVLKSKKKLSPDEVKQLGAVQVKKMLLKDNDCGVAKQNIAKQAGLSNKIAHMAPATYRALLQLDSVADSADTKSFFEQELLFTPADYAGFRQNLKELAGQMHQACTAGHLKLDLDLQAHFSGAPPQAQSCDSAAAHQ